MQRAVLAAADRPLQLISSWRGRRRSFPAPCRRARSCRARLVGVLEDADVVELGPAHELAAAPRTLPSVSPGWPTMNAVRKTTPGMLRSQALDQLVQALAAVAAAHAPQHAVGGVLERHVDVRHDSAGGCRAARSARRRASPGTGRRGAPSADPGHVGDAAHQRRPSSERVVEIAPVGDRVLRDEVHLEHAARRPASRPRARRRRRRASAACRASRGITQNAQVRLQPSAIFT